MPLVSPEIVHDVVADEQVRPPGEAVAVYPETLAPPSEVGAVHVTPSCWFPDVSFTPDGAAGTPTTGTETAVDGVDAPTWFSATTVIEYDAPLLSPVIEQLTEVEVQVFAPGDAVAR